MILLKLKEMMEKKLIMNDLMKNKDNFKVLLIN